MPRRLPNHELRPREHLTEREVEKLIEAAKKNRHGQRDAAIILICFRHGLRVSGLCELQWTDLSKQKLIDGIEKSASCQSQKFNQLSSREAHDSQ
jgi:integrase